jgi:amidophosphoribosyltransferase
MCGIGAIIHKSDDINILLYELLFNLQHRGQDSCGMISYDSTTNNLHELNEFGLIDKHLPNLNQLKGSMGIGHVRYPTSGLITKNEIQPFYVTDFDGISLAHNGNITNLLELKLILEKNDISIISTSDSEIILKLFILFLKQEISSIKNINNKIIIKIIKKIYDTCIGSYSIIIMINHYGLIAFRDIYGIRPLVYYKNNNYIAIASETIAFVDNNNYQNINNGQVLIVNNLNIKLEQIGNYKLIPCLFEYIYFARPESYINDILVYEFREKIAQKFMKIFKSRNFDFKNIDYVIPVPETGLITANSIAELIKKPIKYAIIKNRYTHRTFINPDKQTIVNNIKKIKIIQKLVTGKNLLVVDDSIVRGNTSKYIINELKRCGAKNIYFVSCCPPIRNPNIYGIAIPSYKELIAYNKTEEEVKKELEVDKLFYLDLDSLCNTLKELNPNLSQFETSVFTGKYITETDNVFVLE